MSEQHKVSGSSLLLAFMVGAEAGAVVALLTVPKSGRETRESLGSWARRGGPGEAVARAARAARDAFERVREG